MADEPLIGNYSTLAGKVIAMEYVHLWYEHRLAKSPGDPVSWFVYVN